MATFHFKKMNCVIKILFCSFLICLSIFNDLFSQNSSYKKYNDSIEPTKWTFPNVKLPPNEFKTIFCSGKDRKPISGFTTVVNTGTYNPTTGWNNHPFDTPFYWFGFVVAQCIIEQTKGVGGGVVNFYPVGIVAIFVGCSAVVFVATFVNYYLCV